MAKLFITLGDRSIVPGRMQSQRMDGLIGKIVRLEADGTVPRDNPFVGRDGVRPEIWSIGHRNVQAATLNPTTGELWEVEHGTRGGDEINIAAQGQRLRLADHRVRHRVQRCRQSPRGITQKAGMEQPVYYWDPVIAPEWHDVLYRQPLPRVERQPVHRRTWQRKSRATLAEG